MCLSLPLGPCSVLSSLCLGNPTLHSFLSPLPSGWVWPVESLGEMEDGRRLSGVFIPSSLFLRFCHGCVVSLSHSCSLMSPPLPRFFCNCSFPCTVRPRDRNTWGRNEVTAVLVCSGLSHVFAMKVLWPRKPLSPGHTWTAGHPR